MTETAAELSPVANPVSVTVNNLVPSVDPVNLGPGGAVMFVNQSAPCLLELLAPSGDHAIVSIVLPTSSPVTLQVDYGESGTCYYNLVTPNTAPPPAGGHRIIVSSQFATASRQSNEAA
ncbi:MAG TPA: hypothetical protein VFA89_24770 [Terriglobales bacterium]|nr:hypothetical protein [Terriglobales bacterium]